MSPEGAFVIMVSAASSVHTVGFAPSAQVAGDAVRLGDIADLSALPLALRREAADLVLVEEQRTGGVITLSSAGVRERARALMPALSPWLSDSRDQPIVVRLASTPQAAVKVGRDDCLVVERAVSIGGAPGPRDLTPAACGGEFRAARAFRYDAATGTLRAVRDLKVGETVEGAPVTALAAVQPGERLFVTAKVGPVLINREVVAAEPAPAGRPLFVRADDGSVFAAPAPEAAP